MNQDEQTSDARIDEIRQLLEKVNGRNIDYATLSPLLRQARRCLEELIAAKIAGPLNAHLQAMPSSTLDEKRALARWLGAELDGLGLCVRDPKSGRPAFLMGEVGDTPNGRFQILAPRPTGGYSRTSAVRLTELQLLPAEPKKRLGTRWHERIIARSSERER